MQYLCMSQCIKCGVDLQSNNCYKSQPTRCKKCWNEYAKRHSKPRPKNIINQHNAKPISRFRRLRQSSKRRGHEVSLTFQEFGVLTVAPCVYCQNKLCDISTQGSNLDRLDNSKGYSIDNVQSCCKICNNIRGQFLTVEETHVVVQALLNHRGYL